MANTRPPEESSVRSVWTAKDEETLRELTERRERIMEANRERLRLALGVENTDFENALLKHVIFNAEAIRDALAPFVSARP